MAYKDPQQIERLINKLSYKDIDFYIHLDKKINILPFMYLQDIPRVRFTKNRFIVNWGGYSFVNAVLEGVREILAFETTYDFINVMSAQEYPIKPASYIYDFFSDHKEYSFLSYEEFGSEWWIQGIERVEKYSLTDFNFVGKHYLQSVINYLMPKRKFPLPYTLFGGGCSTWWTLNKSCAEYVIDFLDKNERVKSFSRFIWAPDEIMIPTIIMNSPFKNKVINNNLRYIDWSLGGTNPKILTVEDFDKLKESDKLIARKFDIKVDTAILDLLDTVL